MPTLIAWIRRHTTQLIAVIFWVGLLIVVNRYMSVNDLTFAELAQQLNDVLTGTWYGPLIYIGVYLLRPLILFPASLLTILAGSIFGLAAGFVYALIAGTLSAGLPYALGRWFASDDDPVEEADNRIQQFTGMMRRHPFQAVLTMRLLYLPYDVVSIVAGNLKLPFIAFALATAIGNIGGTFAYVGVGASVEGDITAGQVSLNPAIIALSALILVVSLGISRVMQRRQQSQDAADQPEDNNETGTHNQITQKGTA